jgi:hypothetical protein
VNALFKGFVYEISREPINIGFSTGHNEIHSRGHAIG